MPGHDGARGSLLKDLPAVHKILKWPGLVRLQKKEDVPRWALIRAVQSVLEVQRAEILSGQRSEIDPPDRMEAAITEVARRAFLGNLGPVINATGVILHTNLGRAPLPETALKAACQVARGYSNLELNMETGKRGLRYEHVEGLLCDLTGAEAALVVNNNAAAVFLGLRVLSPGREVVVSRGELVEIGGSFRIPDVLRESGAELVEVGTTNRTHLKDYEGAIGAATGLLLKVHPSNYHVLGFHKEVSLGELVSLGRRFSVPVMQDLGSGCLLEPNLLGLEGEPSVAQTVRSGVALVTFSGDKLLGGPQAGILLGEKDLMHRIRTHPLNRVLRIDKMTLAALEATLLLYRDEHIAQERIPTLAMLKARPDRLKRRAQRLARELRGNLPSCFLVRVCPSIAMAGGGSLPQEGLPGTAVHVRSSDHSPQEILARLRQSRVPVVARIEKDEVLLDVRTLQKGEGALLCKTFRLAFAPPSK